MWKIPKMPKEEDGPGPGAYKAEEAIKKMRWPSCPNPNKFLILGSEKRNSFIHTIINKKKGIPGVGHYKKDEADKLLCKTRTLISPR